MLSCSEKDLQLSVLKMLPSSASFLMISELLEFKHPSRKKKKGAHYIFILPFVGTASLYNVTCLKV